MAAATMKAIKVKSPGSVHLVTDAPVPSVKPEYMLVRVKAVALNPTDWKHVHTPAMSKENHTVGCDWAGEVVEVGPGVTKSFKPGDRVAGFSHGVKADHPESGAFGEFALVKADVMTRVPANVSDEEAATLGVGVATVAQGLYQSLGLPMPDAPAKDKTPVLIYGGSTATGIFAIQFAKQSGLDIITTCSPRNFDFVKKLGADAVFDYGDADKCAAAIREYTKDSLKYAFDCISEGESPKICANALTSASGARYSALLPVKNFPRDDVWQNRTLAYSINGEAFTIAGQTVPAKPDDFEFAKKFMPLAEQLLASGKLKCYPTVKKGGLRNVHEGLEDLRQGRVSGQKLVYRVSDT